MDELAQGVLGVSVNHNAAQAIHIITISIRPNKTWQIQKVMYNFINMSSQIILYLMSH